MSILTSLEAYKVMICFLDDYYNETLSDDLGSLLGDLQLCDDGSPFDPAAWDDWMRAIGTEQPVTIDNAFKAMINFLNDYCKRTSSADIKILLDNMQQKKSGGNNVVMWDAWVECVNEVLAKK